MQSARSRRNPRVFWLRWHRWCGAVVAAFVILLAVSGVLINHAHTLGWDHRTLRSGWWLSFYGVALEVPTQAGFVDDIGYVQLAGQLYRGELLIGACHGGLSGVLRISPDVIAAQCAEALYLLTPEGELIERMEGQPETMLGLGLSGDRLLARGAERIWVVDSEAGNWAPYLSEAPVTWASLVPLTAEVAEQWRFLGAPPDLTWERLLLDLHSGRLFGTVGVIVVDVAGILMVFLAITGAWALLTRPRRTR